MFGPGKHSGSTHPALRRITPDPLITKALRQCWIDGEQADLAGDPMSANPYRRGTAQAINWDLGHEGFTEDGTEPRVIIASLRAIDQQRAQQMGGIWDD